MGPRGWGTPSALSVRARAIKNRLRHSTWLEEKEKYGGGKARTMWGRRNKSPGVKKTRKSATPCLPDERGTAYLVMEWGEGEPLKGPRWHCGGGAGEGGEK